MCGEIEAAADRIITEAADADVRRYALVWKIEAVPALRESLFQPDPVTAIADSWVFFFQMADFFEKGPGREGLGDYHTIAVATSRRLEEELNQVAASLTYSGDVSKARAFMRKWAAEHPIRDSIAGRESTLSRALERDALEALGTFEVAGTLMVTLDDLNRRIEVYSDQLVRQARWEAELFTLELASEYQLDQALPLAERAVSSAERAVATLDRLAPALERVLSVAEEAPKLVAAERRAAVETMHTELVETQRFIQEERIATLAQVTKERIAAVQELHNVVIAEREILTQDIEKVSVRVVDHAFWRAAQLCAGLVAVLAVVCLAGALVFKRLFFPGPAKK
jgi:hypothetical protein